MTGFGDDPNNHFTEAPGQHFADVSNSVRFGPLAPRWKAPPTSGWRKMVYAGTLKSVNLGRSRAERYRDGLVDRIKRDIRRRYVIAVLAPSGAGATTMAATIGQTFKLCRPKNVLVIDADPAFGALAMRIADTARGDIASLLNDVGVETHRDMKSALTVSHETGLEVLSGDRNDHPGRLLSPQMFTDLIGLVERTAVHEVIMVDCGSDLEHPVMAAVLASIDQLVLVSTTTADSAEPVRRAVDWLKAAGHHHLVSRSMVILNDQRGDATRSDRKIYREGFEKATGSKTVEDMPFDRFLAKGGVIDVKNQVDKATRLRLHEIAAKLADLHVPETGRSRWSPDGAGLLGPRK